VTLVDPLWLCAGLAVLPLLWLYRRRRSAVGFPTLEPLGEDGANKITRGRLVWLRHGGIVLRSLVLLVLAVALARPIGGDGDKRREAEGLDIVLVLDTSGSMEARDFFLQGGRPTRLDVVKAVIGAFIEGRPSDRIGMVVFGTEAFTQAPLTLDHGILRQFLERIRIGMAGKDTAIGDGLATAVKRLKDVEAKSKVVILLTDGGNTAGRIEPLAAAEAARDKQVRVYTIGVGSKGEEEISGQGVRRLDIDEDVLKEIAKTTGGAYFRAHDTETLVRVYETIDKLEKTRLRLPSWTDYDDRYQAWVAAALAFLLVESLFGLTRFRRIP
jgi:Ca-activated chloride channel family protein